ncbi:MAG: oligosaccharide flippase family protein [Acidobacteriota bacterium]|nr:oligosaccharide flippase family protein [Acidobacteriota bacterium]
MSETRPTGVTAGASRLRWNAVANLAGTAWASLLAIALVPVYLRYLGIESYALVGIFTVIQTTMMIFDLGLGMTVTRSMARLAVQPDSRTAQRNLVRTVEVVYWVIAGILGAAMFLSAGVIARLWIHPASVPVETVVRAVRLMAVANVFAFPAAMYRAVLLGLDRQVLMNAVTAGFGTIRGFGAVGVLMFIAPNITIFLAWQAIAAASLTAVLAVYAWRAVRGDRTPRFDVAVLRAEWRYAAGVSSSLVLHALISHVDKIVLSGILPLAAFGYYTLGATLASAPGLVTVPINTALFPRLIQLIETRNDEELSALYHAAAQAMIVLVGPGAALLACFAPQILQLWTRNASVAANASMTASLLVCGTTLISLASIAGYAAAAAGKPQVMTKTNAVAAVALVPALILVAPRYGATGAAAVWAAVSLFHVFGAVPLAHREMLRGEASRWYLADMLAPMLAIAAVAIPARWLVPYAPTAPRMLTLLAAVFMTSTLAAALAASRVRALAMHAIRSAARRSR